MLDYLGVINKILSIGAVFLQLIILILFINLIFFRNYNNKILLFFQKHTFFLGFLSALLATVFSLFYSEIVGYPPCELCLVQRIFLYPQLVFLGIILYKKNITTINLGIIFSILGSIISLYHILVESGITTSSICSDPSNGGVSCSIRYIYELGYITMPVMALSVSLFILMLLLNYKYSSAK